MVEHSFLWEGEGEKKPQFFVREAPSASDKEIYYKCTIIGIHSRGVFKVSHFHCCVDQNDNLRTSMVLLVYCIC